LSRLIYSRTRRVHPRESLGTRPWFIPWARLIAEKLLEEVFHQAHQQLTANQTSAAGSPIEETPDRTGFLETEKQRAARRGWRFVLMLTD